MRRRALRSRTIVAGEIVTAGGMRPLEDLIDAANRVAAGERGVRLHPSATDTEIGHVSLAFDGVTVALEAALDDARRASELSQTFLADAAHQLRTPITSIRAAAEVLAMGLDPEDERRAIELLVGESERVGQLLSGLLRLARLDLGEPPVQEPVDLETVCRTEVERARPLSPGLAIALRSEIGDAAPIELDPAALAEVLSNLLDNARRHAVSRIEVQVRVVGPVIEIGVADDGAGLEAADADRVFERFVSLDGDGGSGLGLPIARAIVEAHGGVLVYEDRRFVIRLVRERRHRREPRRRAERQEVPARGDRRRSTAPQGSGQDLPSPVLTGARSGSGRRHDRTAGDAGSPG